MKKHVLLIVILFLLTLFAACNKTVSQDSGSDTTATETTGETTSSHSGSSSTETTAETISVPDNTTESTQSNEIEIDAGDFMEENTPDQTQATFPTMPEAEQTQPSDPIPTTDAEGYQSIVVRP